MRCQLVASARKKSRETATVAGLAKPTAYGDVGAETSMDK